MTSQIDEVRPELLDDKPALVTMLCFHLGYTDASSKSKIEQIKQICYNFPFDDLLHKVGEQFDQEDSHSKSEVVKQANEAEVKKKKFEITKHDKEIKKLKAENEENKDLLEELEKKYLKEKDNMAKAEQEKFLMEKPDWEEKNNKKIAKL